MIGSQAQAIRHTHTPDRGLIFALSFFLFWAAFCSELQFLICLRADLGPICSFWYVLRFLILNLLRLQDAWTAYDRRAETKEERKRTRTTKRYTSNSLKLVEEVTPQIIFLDTKPFVISTDELFQVDAYF